MPLALERRPELKAMMEPYIQAFVTLSSFRNELGKINFADIVLYAEKIEEDEILDFVSIIAFAERAYSKAVKDKEDFKTEMKNG